MKRAAMTMALAISLSVGTAIAQTAGSTGSTNGTTTPTTTVKAALKSGVETAVRTGFTQLVIEEIHNVFDAMRASLGMPASTGTATDPLSLLEAALVNAVTSASTTAASSSQ